ncbi:transposase, partial [Rhizobium johnstonii]|uniref:transposase n=1 Tax=Rhizobium johnstonii TaxID=3019933 RepID=UPI003F94F441
DLESERSDLLQCAPQLRTDKAKGFEVLPRRWVVERTFAWLGRCRRLAKDWEKSVASAEVWITIAHIRVLTRRLARYG